MRLENGMTMPESDASLGQRTSEIQIADNRQRALVPIHATKDPDTWVLGQGGFRPEERASLKLRPERWEMFRVERGVVRFAWDGVDTWVDGDNVTNILRHYVDRKSTRLNSSHSQISYAVFCLKKKKKNHTTNSTKQNTNK